MKKRFLVVTANDNETQALLNEPAFEHTPDRRSGNSDDHTFYNTGTLGNYEVIHFELLEQGSVRAGGSFPAIYLALDYWKPDAVILLGIAFGKDNEDKREPRQHIGDVLVSRSIQDYESGKIHDGTMQSDGVRPEPSLSLLNVFTNYAKTWEYFIGTRRAKCEFGLLLSGDKVVDDSGFKEILFKQYPRAIGGEMEGRGAYSACRLKNMNNWIIIKSICDWAENKGNPNKERDQIIAAKSAVNYLKHVFSKESAFNRLYTSENGDHTHKSKSRPSAISPLGYFINIGTTSCRLFKVVDKNTIKELYVSSYQICDPHDDAYLRGIISQVKDQLIPKMRGSSSQLLQKVLVDYNFCKVFDAYNEPKIQKDFIRDFYKETNLYFNILTKNQTLENLKRLFGINLPNSSAIINIGSHSIDVFISSDGEFNMISLPITLADIKHFVKCEKISEVWGDDDIAKIKNYIYLAVSNDLKSVTAESVIIIKDELRFMENMGYQLKYIEGHRSLSFHTYKIANREFLFCTDYRSKLEQQYDQDSSTINRLHGFKYGHIAIETIIELLQSKCVIPKDDLSIHGSINAYIFNVVISGTTHGNGVEFMLEAHKMLKTLGVEVLSPAVTGNSEKLAKEITPETEYDHLQAIDECDVLFVCNKGKGGHIGEATKCEIYYAYALRKTIAFWDKPQDDSGLSFIPKEHWGAIRSLV